MNEYCTYTNTGQLTALIKFQWNISKNATVMNKIVVQKAELAAGTLEQGIMPNYPRPHLAASGAYLAISAHPPTRANCPLLNRSLTTVLTEQSTTAPSLMHNRGENDNINTINSTNVKWLTVAHCHLSLLRDITYNHLPKRKKYL